MLTIFNRHALLRLLRYQELREFLRITITPIEFSLIRWTISMEPLKLISLDNYTEKRKHQ